MFILGGILSVIWLEISVSYNQWYIPPNENLEYGYPHSNALFNIYLSMVHYFAPNWSFVSNVKQLHQPVTSNVTYDGGEMMLVLQR